MSGIARILLVEGDAAWDVTELLQREGFTVRRSTRGDAVRVLDSMRHSLVILELAPGCDDPQMFCAAIRTRSQVPVVILGNDPGEEVVVACLAAGADAFVELPLGDRELVARVRALIRRGPPMLDDEADIIEVGPVVLDRASRRIHVSGRHVEMPRREFDIAEMLMRSAGRVVSRSQLLHELFNEQPSPKSLDVQVGRLRARLSKAEGRVRIITVRGRGYRFLTFEDDVIDLTAGEPSAAGRAAAEESPQAVVSSVR